MADAARPEWMSRARLGDLLERVGLGEGELVGVEPLGESADETLKATGYGAPVRLRVRSPSGERSFVLRTMRGDRFGHDRRADRVQALVLDMDSFGDIPSHPKALAVGIVPTRPDAPWTLLPEGEPFLLTEYVPGTLYAHDLASLGPRERAEADDLQRAERLADYLALLHAELRPSEALTRALRDAVGSGEGLFGLADAYPADDGVAPPRRLAAIEERCVAWRWRLKALAPQGRRIHGDFHPFNILFDEAGAAWTLDASRGVAGDPADDVSCLSINYVFFALLDRPDFTGALRQVWDRFHARVAEVGPDPATRERVAPYFAWRVLVLANPLWYPSVPPSVRDRLLRFAERLLDGEPFEPERIEALLE